MIETPPLGIINNDLLNPSFEAVWLPIEAYRNLSTNPSFEAVGAPVELRRNHSPKTMFDYFPLSQTSDVALNGDGSAVFLVHTPAVANNIYLRSVPDPQDYLGEDVYACIEITNHGPMGFEAVVDIYDGSSYQLQNSPYTYIPVGETRMVWGSSLNYAGSGTTSFGNRVRIPTAIPAGQSFTARKMGFFTDPPLEWFDGDYSPDIDLTPSWTGTPNASASILTYLPAVGVSNGWSTDQWSASGERSLRVPETLQVGGRNLLVQKDGFTAYTPYNTIPVVTEDGRGLEWTKAGVGPLQAWRAMEGSFPLGTYTLSGYWRVNGEIPSSWTKRFSTYAHQVGETEYDPQTGYYKSTVNNTDTARSWVFHGEVHAEVGDVLTLLDAKLEAGDEATDWSPAPEDWAIATLTAGQTSSIVARNPGQEVFLDGVLHHTTTLPDETVRIAGPGHVGLGEGWWDNLVIVEGRYDGEYFDGDYSPDPDLTPSWTGDPNASASILTYLPAVEVSNGWSTDRWAASGERSLRVPETLRAGGRNLLRDSARIVSNGLYQTVEYVFGDSPPAHGDTVTISIKGEFHPDKIYWALYNTGGSVAAGFQVWHADRGEDGVYRATGEWRVVTPSGAYTASNTSLRLYAYPSATPGESYIEWAKLEVGDTATDWSAAPEDVAIANLDTEQKLSIVARDAGQQVFLDNVLYHTTKQSPETVVVRSPGYVVLGEGFWDNGMVVRKDYDGPYFDGDTPPFRYHGQLVTPSWMYGDPGFVKSRLGDYYEVEPWTPTVEWSKPENRRYSIGADRGMLYRNGIGVPWSGLVSVNRNANDGDVGKRYLDGVLYNVSVPPSDFSATLEAFTYPDEFDECIGNVNYHGVEGLMVHGQESVPFDLCYRTLQGDGNGYGEEYVLHFVYGCMAVDSGHDHTSINDSPEAETFSFEIHGVPQVLPELRPSAYFSIDSRKVNRGLLEGLEQTLYGTDGSQPSLPSMSEIQTYFA